MGMATEPFLKQHCIECHNADTQEGDLDLSALVFDPSDKANFNRWVKIHDRIQAGEMPPADAPRPARELTSKYVENLASQLSEADRRRQTQSGRGVVRRLNRSEFETTVSDLLHVPLRIRELLPPDATGYGFDTVGSSLNMSAVQMESYLQALDIAMDEATKLIEPPPIKKWRLSYLETHGMMEE